jgi:hypothetical protein
VGWLDRVVSSGAFLGSSPKALPYLFRQPQTERLMFYLHPQYTINFGFAKGRKWFDAFPSAFYSFDTKKGR